MTPSPIVIKGCSDFHYQLLLDIIRATSTHIGHTLNYISLSKSLIEICTNIPDNAIKDAIKEDMGVDIDDRDQLLDENTSAVIASSNVHWGILSNGIDKWILDTIPMENYKYSNTLMGKYLAFVEYHERFFTHPQQHRLRPTLKIFMKYYNQQFESPSMFNYHDYTKSKRPMNVWFTWHWMMYFEIFGYRVVDNEIVKADKQHLEKFKSIVKKIRQGDDIHIEFDEKIMKFTGNVVDPQSRFHRIRVNIDPVFVPIISYTTRKLEREGLLIRFTNYDGNTPCRHDSIMKAVLSKLIPRDIRIRINETYSEYGSPLYHRKLSTIIQTIMSRIVE